MSYTEIQSGHKFRMEHQQSWYDINEIVFWQSNST